MNRNLNLENKILKISSYLTCQVHLLTERLHSVRVRSLRTTC
jgi:hypothetical protein